MNFHYGLFYIKFQKKLLYLVIYTLIHFDFSTIAQQYPFVNIQPQKIAKYFPNKIQKTHKNVKAKLLLNEAKSE